MPPNWCSSWQTIYVTFSTKFIQDGFVGDEVMLHRMNTKHNSDWYPCTFIYSWLCRQTRYVDINSIYHCGQAEFRTIILWLAVTKIMTVWTSKISGIVPMTWTPMNLLSKGRFLLEIWTGKWLSYVLWHTTVKILRNLTALKRLHMQ